MRAVVNDRRAVQLEKEKLLLAMTNGLADAKHMEQLVLLVMEQARELVDADRASLFLVETADNVASDDGVARTKGDLYTFLAENADPIRIPAGSGLIGVCVSFVDKDLKPGLQWSNRQGFSLGVLYFVSRKPGFNRCDAHPSHCFHLTRTHVL